MTAIDLTTPVAGSTFQQWVSAAGVDRLVKTVDFAEALASKGSALAQNDTVKAMVIPAGSAVISVFCRQLVAGTASSTFTVGSTATSTLYIASVSNDAAAQTFGYSDPSTINFFSSADTVTLKLGATPPQAGKIEITALVAPVGTSLTK